MKNINVTVAAHPESKDITLLSVKGFIDTTTSQEFERAFQTVLGEKKFKLIVDLREANYISSAGWGIFVGEIKRIRGQKGDLFLAAMTPEVMDAYELLQFETIIKSFPTVDQAVQKGFGKTLPGKAAARSKAKAPEASQPEKVFEPALTVHGLEVVPAGGSPQKLHWFLRIFTPWKWF